MADQMLNTALTWAVAAGLFAVGTALVLATYHAGRCVCAAWRWCWKLRAALATD